MSVRSATSLGTFLRSRRARLDPAAFGFGAGRRRTPGLRREEVAQRANISPTWYTWLEQGRGGAPSADVLNRIAAGMMLTEPEREHLFMLGLGRPPEARRRGHDELTPRLQRVLDAMPFSPAIVVNAIWDVVAWNRAAAAVLTDYATLPRDGRNVLRLMFAGSSAKAAQEHWWAAARYLVAAFRADAVRAGADAEIAALVDELSATSAEFAALWRDGEVAGRFGGSKRLHHPELGSLDLDISAFAVDGRPELGMLVYTTADATTAERIGTLLNRLDSRP